MKPKFAIAIPHAGRPIPCDWYLAMRQLQFPTNTTHVDYWRKGMDQGIALNDMAQQACNDGAEFLLTIDDDTQPPPSTILNLMQALEAHPEAMACGGIYTTKTNPPEPIVYQKRGGGAFWNWKMGDIFPCWGLGNGCLMIRTEVFKDMPKPWFKNISEPAQLYQYAQLFPEILETCPNSVQISPDVFFFARMEKAGHKTLAHGGVLPIHWGADGRPYWLPADTFPTQGVTVNGHKFGWTDPDRKLELVASA